MTNLTAMLKLKPAMFLLLLLALAAPAARGAQTPGTEILPAFAGNAVPDLRPEPLILGLAPAPEPPPQTAVAQAQPGPEPQPLSAGRHMLVAPRGQIIRGAAVAVNGEPLFITAPEGSPDSFTVPIPSGGELLVSLIPDPGDEPRNILLPVAIEDKTLAHGVTLTLLTPKGNTATVDIPPRRVFISIPYSIPVTGDVHPDFADPDSDHLIIQVIPKITKKAQVNIDNTAEDGLVADIRYEGIAHLKLKDILNRTNRRDMDGTFFIGKDPDDRWQLISENLFEKFDKRVLGVGRDKRFSSELTSHWRVDNVDNADDLLAGANFTYKKDKTRVLLGNIDRRVKKQTHMELAYGDEDNFLLTRYEGLEVKNPSDRMPVGVRVDRFGYQVGFVKEYKASFTAGRLGNLRVEDTEDEGEIDDYFNFELTWGASFGDTRGVFRRKKFSISGESEINVLGRGSASWVQGEVNINTTLFRDYLFIMHLNNDFARITGTPRHNLWESFLFSLMRNRDYFNPDDPLARYGLQTVFADLRLVREKHGEQYQKEIRLGIAKYVRIMDYDIPLELFVEINEEGEYRPGAGLSIRDYF